MRSGLSHRRHMPVLGAIVIAASFLIAHAAFAQSDGDEQCSKKGRMWMFDALTKSWIVTGDKCTPPGPSGPADGEKRCGYAGYMLKYVAKRRVWSATQDHCAGSKPYIGWHQIEQ